MIFRIESSWSSGEKFYLGKKEIKPGESGTIILENGDNLKYIKSKGHYTYQDMGHEYDAYQTLYSTNIKYNGVNIEVLLENIGHIRKLIPDK